MPDPTGRRRRPATAAAVLLLLALVGCAAPAAAPATGAAGPPAAVVATPVEAQAGSRPARLTIPALDVDTSVIELGLQPDQTMEVPPDGTTAGWYDRSPTPGEIGPAVLAAHVDWMGAQGVFFRLDELDPGDEVLVLRRDGVTAVFAVRAVEQYPKDAFPSDDVYGDVDGPELRLITCGGDFDGAARSYEDNIVVYAELTGTA